MKVIQQSGEAQVPSSVVGRVFQVFALDGSHGAAVVKHEVKAAPGVELWGIKVGEQGRGRWQSTILVDRPELAGIQGEGRIVYFASIAETRSGLPKLITAPSAYDATAKRHVCPGGNQPADHCIVAATLGIGFRGNNAFTGDVTSRAENGDAFFAASPWIPLAIGHIAQGKAGNMGSGTQMVCLLPRGIVGRTGMGGRLYGATASHYYYFDGVKLHRRTKDGRMAMTDVEGDVFPPMM